MNGNSSSRRSGSADVALLHPRSTILLLRVLVGHFASDLRHRGSTSSTSIIHTYCGSQVRPTSLWLHPAALHLLPSIQPLAQSSRVPSLLLADPPSSTSTGSIISFVDTTRQHHNSKVEPDLLPTNLKPLVPSTVQLPTRLPSPT